MATPEQISYLKSAWLLYQNYDIENVQGMFFSDADRAELKEWHGLFNQAVNAKFVEALKNKAAHLGFPDNLLFAAYINTLERKLGVDTAINPKDFYQEARLEADEIQSATSVENPLVGYSRPCERLQLAGNLQP